MRLADAMKLLKAPPLAVASHVEFVARRKRYIGVLTGQFIVFRRRSYWSWQLFGHIYIYIYELVFECSPLTILFACRIQTSSAGP